MIEPIIPTAEEAKRAQESKSRSRKPLRRTRRVSSRHNCS